MIPSIPKLLGLIAIIWVVWTLFRIFEVRRATIRAQAGKESGNKKQSESNTADVDANDDNSVDLRECRSCGAWFSGENCRCENSTD